MKCPLPTLSALEYEYAFFRLRAYEASLAR